MFRCAALAVTSCAAAPTSSPSRSAARPSPAAALRTPAPHACRPSLASTVSHVGGDAHSIRACFDRTCVSVDRRTGAPTAWTPPPDPAPPPPDVRIVERTSSFQICILDTACTNVIKRDGLTRDSFDVVSRDDQGMLVMTTTDERQIDPPQFAIYAGGWMLDAELRVGDGNKCGRAFFAGKLVVVTTDDCEGSPGRGYLFGSRGKLLGSLEADHHSIDARGASEIAFDAHHSAILAPYAYVVIVLDVPLLNDRTPIDLVPIQAESSTHPSFAAALASDGALVVASPTGGIGAIDPKTLTLTPWIVPRCAEPTTR